MNGGWVRLGLVERARPPEAAEAENERVADEGAARVLQLLDGRGRVAVEAEGDALRDEPARPRSRGGTHEIRSGLSADPAVRLEGARGKVGDEVDDPLRRHAFRQHLECVRVVDIADDSFYTEATQERQLLGRPSQSRDLVLPEMGKRRAAENARGPGEEHPHGGQSDTGPIGIPDRGNGVSAPSQ